MKGKILNKIGLISTVVALALILALVALMFATSAPDAQAAAGDNTAEYKGDNGTLPDAPNGHYSKADVAAKYGVVESEVLSIDSGLKMYDYLVGNNYTNFKVGMLTQDIGLSYNIPNSGYDVVGVNSSRAIFDKVLDGNGYTAKIHGGGDSADSTTEIQDNDSYRNAYRNNAGTYDGGYNVWYEYTGYLVAQNYGTIANLTIDFTSGHTGLTATGENGLKMTITTDKLLSAKGGSFSAGIVAGLNGYGGKIDNVRLNIKNAFTAIKKEEKQTTYFQDNTAYAGGIAGRAEDNSVIENCWVDIASGAGVYGAAEGRGAGIDAINRYCMAIAGGIVGKIDKGTAKLTYCALTGSGEVRAYANRASHDDRFVAYAGGAVGGCIKFNSTTSIQDINTAGVLYSVDPGQIHGIISSWDGIRFSNLRKSPESTLGTLFGSIGTGDVISSIALLFNLETLSSKADIKPTDESGNATLDYSGNNRNGNVNEWLEIYPTTEGGKMTAQFNRDDSEYDIRVHAIADGHDDVDDSILDAVESDEFNGSRSHQYFMQNGEGGKFIWSSTISNIKTGQITSSHISLDRDEPIYAEIYLISSSETGKYNYEFGTMGQLEYSDTNGVEGKLVKPYNGVAAPLKLPKVTMTNELSFNSDVFNDESLWNITRSNSKITLAQTYMPGEYKMKVRTTAQELGDREYGYFDANQRILAWQPAQDYSFTILPGELNVSNTTIEGWQKEVTFTLNMNGADDFDYILFQRNGVFSDVTLRKASNSKDVVYTVNNNTGKNGTPYIFYAYKQDGDSDKYVEVAVSQSITVRIDNEAPEVSEIEYYMVEANGQERLLYDDEVDEILAQFSVKEKIGNNESTIDSASGGQNWTKNRILAKFSVSDNGKSGISMAENAPYVENTIVNSSGDLEVVVTIDDSSMKTLSYVDENYNTTIVELQFNVDRVEGKLQLAGSSYESSGRFNYSAKNVEVYYRANFGASGWTLYYSYQKDGQGNDIWLESKDKLELTDSGAVKTFTIDWNMGDVNTVRGDIFKLKIVNDVDLYNPIEREVVWDSNGDGKNDGFIIWLRVANIYLSTNLDNIFVEGENKSVAEILQSQEERAKYFDKTYDGTDEYDGKKEYKFYTDLSALNQNRFYFNDKMGVIYSPSGIFSRPRIDIGDKVPVKLKYTSTESGATKLSFQVDLSNTKNYTDVYNYIVYFTDLSQIDFMYDVEVEEGKYWERYEIDANINPIEVTIKLGEQDAFNSDKTTYYYGDDVPTSIEVYVETTGQYVTVQIDASGASSTANKGNYIVRAKEKPDGGKNINYTVESTTITIEQRPVAVDLRFDGGEIGNIPTGISSGRTHSITGTYTDVNGETQDVDVQYVLNGKEVKTLGLVGVYDVNLKIENNGNYIIDGQTSFKFNIAKGQLEIETGVRVKDFTEDGIEYDLKIPQESRELYEDSDLEIKYFRYLEGATYNASEGIIEGKWSEEAIDGLPTERGYYRVEVKFISNNDNFFPKADYEPGYLIISKARTQVTVENVTLQKGYTGEMFTFDLREAVTQVRSSSNKQLWNVESEENSVKVQYKENGSYKDVAPSFNAGGGWYSEVGRYEYRISYNGNDDYNSSYVDVVLVITEATLKNITFTSVTEVYDGKSHVPTPGGLTNYTGLKVSYQYGTTTVDDLSKLNLINANNNPYIVYMRVQKNGYQTLELSATVTITKAKMEGVSVNNFEGDYDGNRHYITFNGLTSDPSTGNLYYKGALITFVNNSNSEGNTFATNVKMEEGVGVSYYSGKVILRATNYEDLELNTYIKINQSLLPYEEIGKDLPNKLPSAMALKDYKGYYVDKSGNTVECDLQYLDKNGNVVELDENDTLADGRYTVRLVIADTNYYLDQGWTFEIGEINSADISTVGIIAIAAVGVLMVAAIITAIVVVQKRKKAGIE